MRFLADFITTRLGLDFRYTRVAIGVARRLKNVDSPDNVVDAARAHEISLE